MEKGRYSPREISIAVHPISLYWKEPCKKEMQTILDNPRYLTTLGLNILEFNSSLYVIPKKEIFSPPAAPRSVLSKREFSVIEPDQFIEYTRTAEHLQITLMGGEISEEGIEGVFSAYKDILTWFNSLDSGTEAQTLLIHMPFNALFTGDQQTPFNYHNMDVLDAFKKQFLRSDMKDFTINNDEAFLYFAR